MSLTRHLPLAQQARQAKQALGLVRKLRTMVTTRRPFPKRSWIAKFLLRHPCSAPARCLLPGPAPLPRSRSHVVVRALLFAYPPQVLTSKPSIAEN
jgi:hypothetical protein